MNIATASQGNVLVIGLNRPEKKNAITSHMYTELSRALAGADVDDNVHVIVIKGSSTIFSAGADLADFQNNPPRDLSSPLYQFLTALRNARKPLIASVAGAAVGIGTTMLLHCDLVYASSNARFSLPFAQLGLCPEAASSFLLPRLMGHQRAAELLLLGEPLPAAAALAAGLVNRVVDAESLDTLVNAQAEKLAGMPLASLLHTKRLMKMGQAQAVHSQLLAEAEIFSSLLTGPDAIRAFAAFIHKNQGPPAN